jgi:hypothetical protein
MATIVNTPASERTERVVESSDTGGWAVAVIVLLAVVVIGAFVWMRYYSAPAATQQTSTPGGAQINLTLPSSGSSDNSGSTGGTGSANTNTTGGTGASAPATQ